LRASLLAALAGLLLVAFSALGYAQYDALHRAILGEVDRTLLVRAQAIVREVEILGVDGLDAAHMHELHLAEPLEQADAPEVFVQILNARATVVAASENVAKLSLPIPQMVSQPTFYDVTLKRGRPLRLMAAPVLAGDRPLGIVVVGQSLRLTTSSLRQAIWRMFAVGAVALVATIFFMGVLVRRGLAPLQRVADTAAEIVLTGDMSRRVPIGASSSGNEVEKVAEAFNAVVSRVEQQLEAQRRLLADTSHELGNPLTVLRTDLDMLRQDLDPETRAEIVEEADKEAERMARLVEELLQLSAAEMSLPSVDDAAVDLADVAVRAVTRVHSLAGARKVELSLDRHPVVRGDRDRLGQILNNLLDNAIRHTAQDGEIQVLVREQGSSAILMVKDNGVGIASEHLPHVFERFYRVDRARSRSSGGTGLGLAIARMIAQSHGGNLQVESSPGVGTVFTLTLPVRPPEVRAAEVPESR
jgi:signal transduction histidine kinase